MNVGLRMKVCGGVDGVLWLADFVADRRLCANVWHHVQVRSVLEVVRAMHSNLGISSLMFTITTVRPRKSLPAGVHVVAVEPPSPSGRHLCRSPVAVSLWCVSVLCFRRCHAACSLSVMSASL